MLPDASPLVLEIIKDNDALIMSVFERDEFTSTLRHYAKLSASFTQIDKLCREVTSILNRADKRGLLEPDSFIALKKAGQLLWDHLLIKTVKDRLRDSEVSDLVLSIDEGLVDIPWELLFDGKDFLCLKFNLGRVIKTKDRPDPPRYRSLSTAPKMLILANPTSDLKSAYSEGQFIRNQFDRRRKEITINFKSTNIDTIYVKKNLRDYDIVHFAGHCEYGREASDIGWVLNDGKFAVRDIYAMGETISLPSLIFSNACHSARFNESPLSADFQTKTYSLAAAFIFSGVRHYIGAIRKIEDEASLSFARTFYSHLISGKSVGESVRLSRIELIEKRDIANIWWASYLLYGDPAFALFKEKIRPIAGALKERSLTKKQLFRVSAAVFILLISMVLYMWLLTLNPASYTLFLKSRSLFLKGNNEEAISVSNRLIEKDRLFLAAYPLLADAYRRLGRADKAVEYYFDYIRYSEKKGSGRHLAAAYNGIGWVYHLQGEYPKAFDFYNKAITLSRQNKDRLNEARGLERLAVWYIDKEDYDKALELLMKSSEINRQNQHIREYRYNLACDYFDIGLVFTNKDDFATAKEFYARSRVLFEKLKLKHELSDYYFNLGEIFLFEKQYQKALDYYKKGLKIDEEQGNRPSLASDYNMLGELYMAMDNAQEAEKLFIQSASLSKEINARPELAAAYYNLGILYKNRNKRHKAREYLRQAQEIYRSIDTPAARSIRQEFAELN